MDLARLGFDVDTASIKAAAAALDKLSTAGRNAATGAKDFNREIINAGKNTTSATTGARDLGRELGRVGTGAKTATTGAKDLGRELGRIGTDGRTAGSALGTAAANLTRLARSGRDAAASARKLGDELDDTGASARKASREVREADRATDGFRDQVDRTLEPLRVMQGLLVGLAGAAVVRSLMQTTQTMQRMTMTLTAATGSFRTAQEEMEWALETADRLGQSFEQVGMSYARLAAAGRNLGLTQEEVRTTFEGVSAASTAMGLTAYEAEGAINALQQMLAKGTVQAEELRGQLGERIPTAISDAARVMGMSTRELGKALEQGQVQAKEFVTALTAYWADAYGTMISNTDSVNKKLSELDNAFFKLKQTVIESGFQDALVTVMEKLTEIANSDRAVRIAESLGEAFKTAADNMDLLVVAGTAWLGLKMAPAMLVLADNIALATRNMHALNAATLAFPGTWFARAIVASVAVAITYWDEVKAVISAVADEIRSVGDITVQIGDINSRVGLVIEAIWTTISNIIFKTYENLKALWSAAGKLFTLDFEGAAREWDNAGRAVRDMAINIENAWSSAKLDIEQRKALDDWNAQVRAWAQAGQDRVDQLRDLREHLEELRQQEGENVKENIELTKAQIKALEDAEKAAMRLGQAMMSIGRGLDREEDALALRLDYYGDTTGELEVQERLLKIRNKLEDAGVENAAEVARGYEDQVRAIVDGTRALEQRKEVDKAALKAAEEAAKEWQRIWDNAAEGMQESLTSTFRDALDGNIRSFQDFGDQLLSLFKDIAAQIAAMLVFRPFIGGIMNGLGLSRGGYGGGVNYAQMGAAASYGGVNSGAGTLGGGGMLDNLSSVGRLFSFKSGGLMPGLDSWSQSTFGWGAMGGVNGTGGSVAVMAGGPGSAQLAANAPAAGLANGGSAWAGFGSLSNVLGIAGAAIPGLLNENYAQAGAGVAGAAIGTMIFPGIGTLIGGMLGNLVGGFLGPGREHPAAFANINAAGQITDRNSKHMGTEDVEGVARQVLERINDAAGQIFGPGSRLTAGIIQANFDDGDYFLRGVGGTHSSGESFNALLEPFIREALRSGQFSGLSEDMEIARRNSTGDLNQLIADVQFAGGFRDALAGLRGDRNPVRQQMAAEVDALEQQYEAFTDTVARLGLDMAATNDAFRANIRQFAGLDESEEMTDMERAVETIRARFDELGPLFKQLGISAAEAAAGLQRQLTALRDGFIAGINDQILAITDPDALRLRQFEDWAANLRRDAETLGADLSRVNRLISLSYDRLIEELNREVREQTQRQAEELQRWLDGQIIGGSSSLSTLDKFVEAQQQFAALLQEARGGDEDAFGRITRQADAILNLARDLYASSTQYTAIEQMVRSQVEELGKAMGLPGFATGGTFVVGGAGGVDSQVVSFRASPGERVTVDRPGVTDNDGAQLVVRAIIGQTTAIASELRELRSEVAEMRRDQQFANSRARIGQ